MLQANHVRIGNYLFNTCRENETIVKVTSIDDHQIGCGIEGVKVNLCYQFENYKPIPLTSRMLANFPQDNRLKIEYSGEDFFYAPGYGQQVKLNYLHQLQNLYFAITGEEFPLSLEIITAVTTSIQPQLRIYEIPPLS